MSYTEKEIKEICKKPVRILPEAYQKMLMHVLRFGSPGIPRDQWRECYGMLVGKFSKEKGITVTDALPVTHGSEIGVEFVEENYIIMAQFMDQLDRVNAEIEQADQKLFIVGWYHSHPGMERFLSSVDVRNQISYQPASFPFGIAIVFDNTCVFEQDAATGMMDLGFKIFRLDDPTSTEINIPFSEVPFDRDLLDHPGLIKCWKNDMKMIENIQKRAPFIEEYKETPSIFGTFKVPTTKELKEAGTGISPEDRAEISILPLSELDQIFTRGMQVFMETYDNLSQGDKVKLDAFLDGTAYPLVERLLSTLVDTLIDWTRKLRVDIDKRVNYGISALNTVKQSFLGVQDEYMNFLKESIEKGKQNNESLVKESNALEATFNTMMNGFKEELWTIFEQSRQSLNAMIDRAGDILGKNELTKIMHEIKQINNIVSSSHENDKNETANGSSSFDHDAIQDTLAKHLQAVQELQVNMGKITIEREPPALLGNFIVPKTSEIESMEAFVDDSEGITEDLSKTKNLATYFKDGLKKFIEFYQGLSDDGKKDFTIINEKGIQPLSDLVISSLVRGINQWTVALRDDIDKRVNLLVSLVNEMERTMRNMQSDYVSFMATSADPSMRMQMALEKTLASVETSALTVFNNILSYLEQVLQNIAYVYQQNLEKQNQLLDGKELKKISKSLDQLRKALK
ncbi:hypothetical protein GF325_03830 [Candidatus Bathyarchaeota archaeon]|nr:hypothetical protein [Candidatus Bathyarchaeota archaeon]